jgi:hypothetical protein
MLLRVELLLWRPNYLGALGRCGRGIAHMHVAGTPSSTAWVRSNLAVIVGTGSMMSVTSILYEEIEIELKKNLLIIRFLLSYHGPIPIVLHIIFSFLYLLYHVDR